MSTEDGIADDDWGKVTELAIKIANVSAKNKDTTMLDHRMLKYLEKLANKYGRLPSIVSTMADYTEDLSQSLAMQKEAYVSACEMNCEYEMVNISESIAEIYINQKKDNKRGKYWLSILKANLKAKPDEYFENQ